MKEVRDPKVDLFARYKELEKHDCINQLKSVGLYPEDDLIMTSPVSPFVIREMEKEIQDERNKEQRKK